MFKLQPFKKLLAMSNEKIDEVMAGQRARHAESSARMELSKIEHDIVTKETKIHEMSAKRDINFPELVEELDKLGILKRRKEQYEDILNDMFPSDTKK